MATTTTCDFCHLEIAVGEARYRVAQGKYVPADQVPPDSTPPSAGDLPPGAAGTEGLVPVEARSYDAHVACWEERVTLR